MRQGSGGYVQNFILGGHFWGALGGGGLDCGQYQILTDPRNGLKNPNMNFGNDRSHRLGGVSWQTDIRQTDRRLTDDRQTDDRRQTYDRQTDKSNPSVPYDTFDCFAGLINKVDMQFPHILQWKLHTQGCEILGGTKRKLCNKFQVDICKTKKR